MAVKRPMLREGKAFQECVQKSTISEVNSFLFPFVSLFLLIPLPLVSGTMP
jgi:hypothetical protein